MHIAPSTIVYIIIPSIIKALNIKNLLSSLELSLHLTFWLSKLSFVSVTILLETNIEITVETHKITDIRVSSKIDILFVIKKNTNPVTLHKVLIIVPSLSATTS